MNVVDIKIHSEEIEPGLAYITARWWAQAEQAKLLHGNRSPEHLDALERMWLGLDAMRKLLVCCPDAVHAGIAASNNLSRVQIWMEATCGVIPSTQFGGWK